MNGKKLTRSLIDRKIAGVCGGLGEYLNVDPTIIRIIWAMLALIGGGGLILYLICALVIPEASY
ncbi:PspC domain-containing protein [Criibacterium bergeronii]|uniref:PspC domain-containing protein n=1 Tax=Criibacterium bergeronii TaxID=1871336 RepID=A0A371INN7_9FIRM|nr:PspC domain-containing protein [Criibacterium bergeronii]MBS6063617.1 PspC domain-containing protein [Peptostreptococcaceae bacterium]RDY22103.1 PspC domain-containing protein [Criibacterium bergeronii]